MAKPNLKPCPFCGNTKLNYIDGVIDNPGFYNVYCLKCSASWWTDQGNFDGWNTRPAEDALQAELNALKQKDKPYMNAFMRKMNDKLDEQEQK